MSIKRFFPNTRPTLDLNFAATKRIDPRITYTRASTGTFVDLNGLIQSAAVDQARFDHNPTTGESLGLLVEEARTNLLLNSATLSTQSVTVAAADNTLSFYGTGTVTLTGVSTAGPLVGTGANNRVSLTFTPTVGVLILTVSGSVTNAQLEAGAFPTSYIPTTSATATRAADVASITGTNFSSFYNALQGVIYAEFSATTTGINSAGGSAFPFVYHINSAGAINSEHFLVASNGYGPGIGPNTQVLGVPQTIIDNLLVVTTLGNLTVKKTAYGYKENDFGFTLNAGTVLTDTLGTVPSTPDRLCIGNQNLSGNIFTGTIKRLTYYPIRLPNAQLQALTAN